MNVLRHSRKLGRCGVLFLVGIALTEYTFLKALAAEKMR